MEVRYLEANRREYELTKHVSLRQLDPLALVRLRTSGVCDFEIPEALFDMDHPGQYFRRIRTIAVSLPSVAGPYASVSARLTQVGNRYHATTARAAGAGTPKEEYEEAAGNDSRFVYNVGASQSIATSSGQNDAGERRPEAHVDAGAERQVTIRLPADVQPLGIREGGGVTVRRGQTGENHLAPPNRPAVAFGVSAGLARLAEVGE